MTHSITIKDNAGAALPSAQILFLDSAANVIATIPVNASGTVLLDDEFDSSLFAPGMQATFTAPGYWSYGVTAAQIPGTFNVTLEKKISSALMLGLGALGGIAVLGAAGVFGKDTKRKVKGYIGAAQAQTAKAGLPSWVVPLGGLAIVGGTVIYLLNKKDPKAADSAQVPDAAGNQLNTLSNQGVQPTITAALAETMSAQIVEATDDCGTDEDAIYNVFAQLQNDADFWLLVKTFGVREIHSCFSGNWFSNTPYNLPQIITAELSSSERETLNNILTQTGINYQF